MKNQLQIWGNNRISYDEAIKILEENIKGITDKYDVWVFAWSGGKDSTTVVTLLISMIQLGQIKPPKKIIVLYADTRMEFTPLFISTMRIIDQLRKLGIEVRIVTAEMEKRFFVYMLGRGVPPPNNNTLRWCTRQIKLDPMQSEIEKLYKVYGKNMLLMTGVRLGESAIRDQRILTSCSKDGGECGQGWFQQSISDKICDKLAPILHFRVCTVWDWLKIFAPMKRFGGWDTELLAIAYGGEEAEEKSTRTGCNGCPLVEEDKALDGVLRNFPEWNYLQPLKRLRPIYRWLRLPTNRLRKTGIQFKKDGNPVANPNRMGPLTMKARRKALLEILRVQREINQYATIFGKPKVDMINIHEIIVINTMIASNTWPKGWDGTEQTGDMDFDQVFKNGTVQNKLFSQKTGDRRVEQFNL